MKVHYAEVNNDFGYGKDYKTLCGIYADENVETSDCIEDVTCQRCLAIIERKMW